MTYRHLLSSCLLTLFIVTPALSQQAADAVAPETDTQTDTSFADMSEAAQAAIASKKSGAPVVADEWMIVAGNPLAVQAELCLNLGDAHHQAARFSVSFVCSIPSVNLIPSITFGN